MKHTFPTRNKKTSRFPKPLRITAIGLVCLGLAVVVLEATNVTYIFHAKPVAKTAVIPATTEQAKKPVKSDKATTPTTPQAAAEPTPTASETNKGSSDTPTQPATPTGIAPDTPSGTFLSNHNPSLDGDPYPSGVQSICTTTPGATCAMTFKNGDLTRTLQAQTTNSDGNAFWTWDVKQSGFTEGSWTLTVTATLNGQTRTAQDNLKVGS